MGQLTDAFDQTVKASSVTDVDAAAVAAGRVIAEQIDYASKNFSGQDLTKALYLTPHLMNVLKELLATPKVRIEVGIKPGEKPSASKLGNLRSVHGKSA